MAFRCRNLVNYRSVIDVGGDVHARGEYMDLVANVIMLHNVHDLTEVLLWKLESVREKP